MDNKKTFIGINEDNIEGGANQNSKKIDLENTELQAGFKGPKEIERKPSFLKGGI